MDNIEQTKLRLEQMLRDLTARAEEIDEDLSSPGDDDWQEAATESANDEVLEEVGDVTMEEIAQIKQALAQIAAGRYGTCVVCAWQHRRRKIESAAVRHEVCKVRLIKFL